MENATNSDALADRDASGPIPTLFLGHGAPPLLEDAAWMAELRSWSRKLPRPKQILIVSAHWESQPVSISATRPVPLVYDFAGFDHRYYRVRYPAPPSPWLADRMSASRPCST